MRVFITLAILAVLLQGRLFPRAAKFLGAGRGARFGRV